MNLHRGSDDRIGLRIILAGLDRTGEWGVHDIDRSIIDASAISAEILSAAGSCRGREALSTVRAQLAMGRISNF